jgi:hypothetical protein
VLKATQEHLVMLQTLAQRDLAEQMELQERQVLAEHKERLVKLVIQETLAVQERQVQLVKLVIQETLVVQERQAQLVKPAQQA